jgi:beta-lactam-binding protein with PASTA domain
MQIRIFKNLLWLTPFISFLIGYQLLNVIYTVRKMPTPSLVGKQLSDAIKIVSKHNLNLRIITEKIDSDLPENTILTQTPAYQNIKQNQAIFVVVSKRPSAKITPNLCGYSKELVKEKLAKQYLKSKNYYLPSTAPKGNCICQIPSAKQELKTNKILTYISTGNIDLVIMPSFIDKELDKIEDFLTLLNIKINISRLVNKYKPHNIVIDQKPTAGSIINLSKLNQVHLYITTKD